MTIPTMIFLWYNQTNIQSRRYIEGGKNEKGCGFVDPIVGAGTGLRSPGLWRGCCSNSYSNADPNADGGTNSYANADADPYTNSYASKDTTSDSRAASGWSTLSLPWHCST